MMMRVTKGALFFLSFCLMTTLCFTSCSESDDTVEEYPDWQNYNSTQWNQIYADATQRIAAGDTSWKIIKNWSIEDSLHTENTAYIVVHVLNEGTGAGSPLYTDSVRVHYTGWLLPSTSYNTDGKGYMFDTSLPSGTTEETAAPAQFLVSGLTDGFATALQNMHIGDEWEVYVPWTLGYGTAGSSTIPGYSVLIFDIKLLSYYRAGYDVPDFKGKNGWVTSDVSAWDD
jgi:FKBP-type peptidyl-prolyl cis-trans isomerase FklB